MGVYSESLVRKDIYKDLDLESVYLMRGEYNDLLLGYRRHFFTEFLSKIKGVLEESKAKANFELLKKMKKAGCWQIDYGIESGNQEILQDICKSPKADIDFVLKKCELIKKYPVKLNLKMVKNLILFREI